MKKQRRSKKGSVSIGSRDGMLGLRWTYETKKYYLALGLRDTPINRQTARTKSADIERDLAREEFDATLEKYKPKPIALVEMPKSQSTIALWKFWMEKQREDGVSSQTLSNRYQTILRLLTIHKVNVENLQDAKDFQNFLLTRQSPSTANRNLKMLTTFCHWCIKQGTMETNPFTEIKFSKASGKETQHREPFSLDEIDRILSTFRLHPYYFRYHDFVLVLLTFGMRPSEAIGIQWKDINLAKQTITISQSLSRTGEGSKRLRKIRKNGKITVLDLPKNIHSMLQGRNSTESKPHDLIFTGPKGKAIDDHNFSQRIWKKVLEQAGVSHRPPYNCRHSMASHAIDQGLTLPETAYLLGHKDTTMVSKVYGHMVNRPQVPRLGI